MLLDNRNLTGGFAARVQKNLDYLINARRDQDADVHIVAQLITSLLGLLVFPYEKLKEPQPNPLEAYRLIDLTGAGWPAWTFIVGETKTRTLYDLVKHLRNAVAHRDIFFLSESRKLHEVNIEFRDRQSWGASISADRLLEFVRRLSELLQTVAASNPQ